MQNVRSLKSFQLDNLTNCRENKLSCFQDVVLLNQFDVIALTETWLNNSITDYEVIPNGYQLFRKDRSTGKRGGGVLLAVKDSISTEPFNFNCESMELSSVVIKSLSKRVLIAVCYRPPNADSDFLHNLNSFIEFAIKSNLKDIILLGDFNFPTIQWINGSGFPEILHQKESLRKRARKSNSALLWEKFRELRRSAKRMIKTKKRDYIRNLANTIKFNPKQFWKFFKSKSNKSTLPDTRGGWKLFPACIAIINIHNHDFSQC